MSEIQQPAEEQPKESKPAKKSWKEYLHPGAVIGIVLGAVGGYLYYHFIGCRSGSCPINSNPWISTLWGLLIGYLLGDMFRFRKKKTS